MSLPPLYVETSDVLGKPVAIGDIVAFASPTKYGDRMKIAKVENIIEHTKYGHHKYHKVRMRFTDGTCQTQEADGRLLLLTGLVDYDALATDV